MLSLMSLLIGFVIRLLSCNEMVGNFGKHHESFENLSDSYLQPNADKNTLLEPPSGAASTNLPLLPDKASDVKALYTCSYSSCTRKTATHNPQNTCPGCNHRPSAVNVYVKEFVTYMVMDDLELKPLSTIKKGCKFLKASLESKTTLTDVFLMKGSSINISE
ncbi:hypothetical protein UlMin_036761 [Ulmus minor]